LSGAVRPRTAIAAVLAVAAGLAIAFVDSRPGYDATGITAVALFGSAALATLIAGERPVLWALLVGVWAPLIEITTLGNAGSLLALLFAGAGAAVGFVIGRRRPGPVSARRPPA
jgi:hypothetical protein